MRLKSSFSLLSLGLILLFLINPTIADLNVDKQALLNFAAIVPHARKLNWNATSPICTSWVGVSCDTNSTRVTALRLPGIGFLGPIPSKILKKLDALTILSLHSNGFTGPIPSDILSLPNLQYVYLQHNNFSGNIPFSFSPQLDFLDLSFNSLTGAIPSSIQNSTSLTGLNLQNNSLTGPIPNFNLPNLRNLNFSNNNLNGSIPYSLQKFPSSSFSGNRMLCGSPLNQCSISPSPSPLSSPAPSPSPTSISKSPSKSQPHFPSPPIIPRKQNTKKKLSSKVTIALAFGGLAILFLSAMTMVFYCFKVKKRGVSKDNAYVSETPKEDFSSAIQESNKNKLVFFDGLPFSFDLEDLLRASAEVMGKGSYGTSYKALLEDGSGVVVKRLKEVVVSKREFEQQMEDMGRVDHPNVVPLRAYYYSKDEKLLVYDCMLCGSFSAQLHGNRSNGRTLNWEFRVKICLGAAKGIAHIHSLNNAKFAHGNIKSSNILLTRNLQPYISDFGLAPIMIFPTIPPRTPGYQAPELIETRKFTQKSDIYSFGVLLLEMLTGKMPVCIHGYDDAVDLPRWVQSVVREEWTAEVFDVELIKYRQNIEEEMVQMLQIAMACVEKVPDMRPNMDQVVRMIQDIRVNDSGNRSSEDNKSISPIFQTP